MALIPVFFRDWFDDYLEESLCPSRFLNKRYRSDCSPEDIIQALDTFTGRSRRKRGWRHSNEDDQDGIVAKKRAGEFQVTVDMQHYKPEEISVKATNQSITVEGRHEEKDCENGYVLRHFVRRYQLPEGHDNDKISSTLSSDGVLTISAPKLALPEPVKERAIPVKHTEKPEEVVEKQKTQEDKSVTLEDLDE